MIRVSNQVTIKKPRTEVFKFLSNFENIPLWNYYVINVKQLPWAKDKGRRYHQIRQNDSQSFLVKEELFSEQITIETEENSNIWFRRKFRFDEDEDGNCVLDDNFEMDLESPQMVQQLFRSKIGTSVKENLTKLKELLELGNTVLQNGKISKLN